jgi:hypothetical protein
VNWAVAQHLRQTEPPLWSIALAMLVILIAPIIVYSWAPTGPLREGDTIFAEGEQRVTKTTGGSSYEDSCLLDPGTPLIVIQHPIERPDERILADVQGNSSLEWPFCPAGTEVLIAAGQTVQKPALIRGVIERLTTLFGH